MFGWVLLGGYKEGVSGECLLCITVRVGGRIIFASFGEGLSMG